MLEEAGSLPESGLVLSATGSGGPADQVRVEIQATYRDGTQGVFIDVSPINLLPEIPFDVVVTAGMPAWATMTAEGVRWCVAWYPDSTDCGEGQG